jgi:hypothetical protein
MKQALVKDNVQSAFMQLALQYDTAASLYLLRFASMKM